MSAPDDKISSNRRRLFKALSTAPVVMTLKPGAALANASAFQCAEKILNPATEPTLEVDQYWPSVAGNFVSRTYDYFVIPQELPAQCVDGFAGKTLVYVDPALYGISRAAGLYDVASPGIAISAGFIYQPGSGGTAGTLSILNNGNQACEVIAGTKGDFAVFYDVQSGDLTGIAFPAVQPAAGLQGLTTTCLASLAGLPTQQGLLG